MFQIYFYETLPQEFFSKIDDFLIANLSKLKAKVLTEKEHQLVTVRWKGDWDNLRTTKPLPKLKKLKKKLLLT